MREPILFQSLKYFSSKGMERPKSMSLMLTSLSDELLWIGVEKRMFSGLTSLWIIFM